jgi:hypothetical protein
MVSIGIRVSTMTATGGKLTGANSKKGPRGNRTPDLSHPKRESYH